MVNALKIRFFWRDDPNSGLDTMIIRVDDIKAWRDEYGNSVEVFSQEIVVVDESELTFNSMSTVAP